MSGRNTFPRIIYFTESVSPTDNDYAVAHTYGAGVVFRNARYIDPDATKESCEPCDGVAGLVPKCYRHLPTAEKAMEAYAHKFRHLYKAPVEQPVTVAEVTEVVASDTTETVVPVPVSPPEVPGMANIGGVPTPSVWPTQAKPPAATKRK